MIRALIIDDEDIARENLRGLLEEYCPEVEIIGLCCNVAEGIAGISEHDPDLIFLDVRMQGETGFDLLAQIKDVTFDVIFTTAHDEYALKAFKFSAVDYILKPIDIQELKAAVAKAQEKLKNKSEKNRFSYMMDNMKSRNNSFNKIALPTTDGLTFVKRDDIIRCESADNYTQFFLVNGGKIMVSKTIKYFEELLEEYNFFRVHQSHLINLTHIVQYHKGKGGYAVMADNSAVIVSRRKKEAFLSRLA